VTRESLELREKRRELSELEASKDSGGALYDAMHQSLLDDIAELEGQPMPVQALPETKPAPETPMPKIAINQPDPAKRVAHLMEKIHAAAKSGEKLYWAQQEVRKLCEVHGLDVPPEAAKVTVGASGGKHQAPAKKTVARPGRVDENPTPAPRVVHEAPEPTPILVTVVEGIPALSSLRSQALSLLAILDRCSPDEAAYAKKELAVISEIMDLAFSLVSRRVA
jgi:hypothetical protein